MNTIELIAWIQNISLTLKQHATQPTRREFEETFNALDTNLKRLTNDLDFWTLQFDRYAYKTY